MSTPAWWHRVIDQVAAVHRDDPANLPGAVFGVETPADGRLIASVGESWSTATICEIGTMTKAFTATAVLLALEEQGRLDVEIEVWRLPGMQAYATHPEKRKIRVRHLLQHTSGLPTIQHYTASPKTPCNDPKGAPPCCPQASRALGPTSEWTCYPGGTNEYMYVDGRCQPARTLTLEQVSQHIMKHYEPETEPGTEYFYSPINHVVAARITEMLSGQSINVFLKQRLFGPLGMTDSFFVAQPTGDSQLDERIGEGVSESQRARIANVTMITRNGGLPPEVAPGPDGHWDKFRRGWRFVFPDGGMYTTVADLLTFLRVLRDGGWAGARRVLSPEIVKLLADDHGYGHTMGFGYRRSATPYGQGPGTLEHLGSKMTYCWLDLHSEEPLLGVFFSQRLPNIAVNPNMGAGMKVIFRVFVPAVTALGAEAG
jgi:CubicO group peptidase (beta-lactamase class C family)